LETEWVESRRKGEAMIPANDPARSRVHDSSNGAPPEASNTSLPVDVMGLTEECKRLRSELARVQQQRDQYLEYLSALTYQGFDLTKEEVLALVEKQKPFREFIAELEQSLGS